MTYKIEMRAKDLRDDLTKLKLIIEPRSTSTILGRVLFDGVAATVTDLDHALVVDLSSPDTVANGEGRLVVEFADLARYMAGVEPSALVTLAETDDGQGATISDGEITRRLAAFPPEDFQLPARNPTTTSLYIPAEDLHAALTACRFALSGDDVRYFLNGVYLGQEDGRLVMVATDGHKLAKVKPHHATAWPDDWPAKFGAVIVRRKAVEAMIRLCAKDKACRARIRIEGDRGVVDTPRWTLHASLIDGTFPDYRRVIPEFPKQWIAYDAGAMAKRIKRLVGQSGNKHATVVCDWPAGQWHVGEHTAVMSMPPIIDSASDKWREGEAIGINGSYYNGALAMLAGLSEGVVQYIMPKGGDPVLFEPAQTSEVRDVLALIMPMRF